MNKLDYLSSLRNQADGNREIYYTWNAFGELKATNNTKVFTKDTIFQVTEEGPLKDAIVYCKYGYNVDPKNGFDPINWKTAQKQDVEGQVYFYQGVVSPNFQILLTPDEYHQIDTAVPIPEDFIPFTNNNAKTSSISISDQEYMIVAAELGVPFLREEELEYNRDIIIDICIKPAIDQYYAFFPIIIDEAVQGIGPNQEYFVEYHTFPDDPSAVAYKGIPYMTMGAGGGTSAAYGTGAFSFMREQYTSGYMGGSSYGFGRGITYNKPVPGFTGRSNGDFMSAYIIGRAAQQGYINYNRREYDRDVFKNNKRYVHGFASTGGALNIHWMCMSTDYARIDYWMLPEVRKLCTANALRNLGALRSLIKPSDNNPIDFSGMQTRADALESKVLERWSKDVNSLSLAIRRGGL
jgi:hypothetical protein